MGRRAISVPFFKWGRLSAPAELRCQQLSGHIPQAATLTCMVLRNRRRCDNCTNNGLLRTVSQLASSRKTFRKPQPRLWPARRARRAPRLARGKSRHCQSGTLRMSPTYQRLPSHDSPWTPRRTHCDGKPEPGRAASLLSWWMRRASESSSPARTPPTPLWQPSPLKGEPRSGSSWGSPSVPKPTS